MNINTLSDYIYTCDLDLNLDQQRKNANYMYEFIRHNIKDDGKGNYNGHSTMTTKLYSKYNYLLYPLPGMHKLYEAIRTSFHECNKLAHDGQEPHDDYFIQSWLNFYRKGEFIGWHGHWPPEVESWHGFYCIDVEPDSKTTYRLPGWKDGDAEIDVHSKDNLMVISKSDGDRHKSSEWNHEDRARITVAFDIVPAKMLFNQENKNLQINHWIPI